MTGLEYAVWQEGRWGRDVPLYESRSPDLRMAAIFFVFGADPAHNACTGEYEDEQHSGLGSVSITVHSKTVLPGFRDQSGLGSVGVQPGWAGLRALLVEEDGTTTTDDTMLSALWLMETIGRDFHVTADYAPLLKHHEDFADETDTWPTGCSPLEDRVMTILLSLNRASLSGPLAADIVSLVLHAEIVALVEAVAGVVGTE